MGEASFALPPCKASTEYENRENNQAYRRWVRQIMLPPSRASTGCRAIGLIHTWVEGRLAKPMVVPTVKPEKRMTCIENSENRIYSP